MILTCWHCGEDFEYTPSGVTAGKPREYFQGSTVCLGCVRCMGGPCMNPAHGSVLART